MINKLTPESIAATVMLLRDSYEGAILVLEGTSDIKLYSKFIDDSSCQVVNGFNKANVLAVIEILDEKGIVGVIAFVDSDFWRIQRVTHDSPNILVTDTHDLETMMLRSSALEDVLREHGSVKKISRFTKRHKIDIRTALMQATMPIACLRLISDSQRLNLKFEGVRFASFTSKSGKLEIKITKLTASVCQHSQRHDLNHNALASHVRDELEQGHDPWQLCNGHDAICILSISLRRLFGTNNSNDVQPPLLERSLRLAYQFAHFMETDLYTNIKRWEEVYGYRLLIG